MPTSDPQFELEELGLLPAEAQVYLALIRNGPLAASAIAKLTDIPRSSVYPTLNSLVDKGLVQGGAGYGSRFTAIPAKRALPALIRHEKEQVAHRESVVEGLSEHLESLAVEPAEAVPEELIQVIRNPRAVAERFNRLRLEAERSVEVFVKAPIFIRADGDPLLKTLLRRGVESRGLYERAVLNDPVVAPYLAKWIAEGEQARSYHGELPHKLAIFDRQSVFVHLKMAGDQMRTVFIRHQQLAMSFGMLFDSLWQDAKPIDPDQSETNLPNKASAEKPEKTDHAGQRISRNGRRGQPATK